MQSKSHELLWALIAIAFITLAYLFVQVVFQEIPAASGLYGHSMGILGFLLMVMTETLYSLRKRSHNARWGKMASWLGFHIFTGLVGPYLVLLHSAWRFQGLAGIVMLLTLVVVGSGFIGRYIYTAIPRRPSGEELSLEDLESLVRQTELNLQRLQNPNRVGELGLAVETTPVNQAPAGPARAGQVSLGDGMNLVWGRVWIELRETIASWRDGSGLNQADRERVRTLALLRRRKNRLQRQVASLAAARNMLAIWHALHIPIGLTLFVLAFLHIFAAIYYTSILR